MPKFGNESGLERKMIFGKTIIEVQDAGFLVKKEREYRTRTPFSRPYRNTYPQFPVSRLFSYNYISKKYDTPVLLTSVKTEEKA